MAAKARRLVTESDIVRILIMPSSYPPVLGGVQTVAHTLAGRLAASGHQIKVVTNRYPRSLPAAAAVERIEVARPLFLWPDLNDVWRGRPDLYLASFYHAPVTLCYLLRLMRRFRPEVVNVHFPDGQIPFILWLRRWFDFRLVISLHGDEVERHFRQNYRTRPAVLSRLRAILQLADKVTACSQYLLDKAASMEPTIVEKGYVIHNGIDVARFQDKRAHAHPRPYAFAFGRLTRKKGFDLLLDAWAQAGSIMQNLDLIIAGEGEEKTRLSQQMERLGLVDTVHFFGRATPTEVVHLLNGAQFAVVPSRQEPFGIVALEALAAQKPVLGTAVGGLKELLESTPAACHLLAQPTVDSLCRGLQTMVNQWRSNSLHPHQISLATYAWENRIQQYEQLLLGKE